MDAACHRKTASQSVWRIARVGGRYHTPTAAATWTATKKIPFDHQNCAGGVVLTFASPVTLASASADRMIEPVVKDLRAS